MVGVSKASLESPLLPWKDAYKRTFTCLQFKYILRDKNPGSSLQIFVGTQKNMAVLWKLSGYHGNKASQAQISWESRRDIMVQYGFANLQKKDRIYFLFLFNVTKRLAQIYALLFI